MRLIEAIELTKDHRDKICLMAMYVDDITSIKFDENYGTGMLYIQQEGHDKGEVIHWYEFCLNQLSPALGHTWGELEIDTSEVSSEPCHIVDSQWLVYEKVNAG